MTVAPLLPYRLRAAAALCAVALVAGCSGLPDKPTRPTMYDFGPGQTQDVPQTRQAPLPAIALAEVEPAGVLEGSTAMLYRLAYAEAQQLKPYAQARWSAPPAQLVRQRVREVLSQRRPVLTAGESAALARSDGLLPLVLHIDLEEFSQIFTGPQASDGVVRLRATLVDSTPSGEKLLAQRLVTIRRPAPSGDAAGGAQAMAAATQAAAEELDRWLQQVPVPPATGNRARALGAP